MSFDFKWPTFSDSFYEHAKHLLFNALNKGDKPAIIADRIHVTHLDMGTIPPELEILEIGDLGSDRFKGIFRMTYAGDASICLQTKVQANPLRQKNSATTPDIITSPSILFASTPLIVPMNLKLSTLKLRAIVVLVISRLEGITLVFKNDPLESVQVSSTFDSVSAIQAFLQAEIERQLRELFRTELPGIIHQLSRRWLRPSSSLTEDRNLQSSPQSPIDPLTPSSSSSSTLLNPPLHPNHTVSPSLIDGVPDEVESYDPTYGLRPSHPPLTGCFSRYRSLLEKKNRSLGLGAALTVASDEEGEDRPEQEAFDQSSVANSCHPSTPTPSSTQHKSNPTSSRSNGSTIAKPRIFHSNSAGLIDSHTCSSAVSSLLGQDDSQSIKRIPSPQTQKGSGDIRERNRLEEIEEREGDLLRSRRMERFSTHGQNMSSSSLPALHRTQTSRISSPRFGNSTLNSPLRPGMHTHASCFSILPSSTQHTSLYSFSPQGDPFYHESRTQGSRSPIFLASRSTSTEERSELNFEDDDHDHDDERGREGGEQCALLASLVRGNWTLSPFSRSISHFASRSTPLSPERRRIKLDEQGRNRRVDYAVSYQSHHRGPERREMNDPQHFDDQGGYWDHERLEGFKQKRVTKIGKF